MSLKLNSSGGGSVTLQEPVTASDLTVNLPATLGNTGNSMVVTSDASGNVGIGTSSSGAKLDVNGSILCRAGGGEGGEISLNNPDNASVGVIFDVGVADSARLFSVRNNFSLALGQIAGTGGTVDVYTAGSLRTRTHASGGLSLGTTSDPGAGSFAATGNITAYFSDERLKTKLGGIENALDKVDQLSGFYYEANETARALGYKPKREVGVSAQQVQAVMSEVVSPAPIDPQYLTVDYERLVPLLIEAIKELRAEVKALKDAA
jgi:hypothetical protein